MSDHSGIYPPNMGPRRSPETDLSAEQETRAHARELLARRIVIIILAFLVATSLGVNTIVVVAIRNQQVDRAPITDEIANCTTPGRACYVRGQNQLKAAIAQLNQSGAAIAACASGADRVDFPALVKCALSELKRLPPIVIPQNPVN